MIGALIKAVKLFIMIQQVKAEINTLRQAAQTARINRRFTEALAHQRNLYRAEMKLLQLRDEQNRG